MKPKDLQFEQLSKTGFFKNREFVDLTFAMPDKEPEPPDLPESGEFNPRRALSQILGDD